jgi:hypothetical protein
MQLITMTHLQQLIIEKFWEEDYERESERHENHADKMPAKTATFALLFYVLSQLHHSFEYH